MDLSNRSIVHKKVLHHAPAPIRSKVKHCSIPLCSRQGHIKNGAQYYYKGLCYSHFIQSKNGTLGASVADQRPAIIKGDVALIPLGVNAKHGYAMVDVDMIHLADMKWHISNGYPSTNTGSGKERMHRMIIGVPEAGMVIDHINRDKLDNRSANLRHATVSENALNRGRKHGFVK